MELIAPLMVQSPKITPYPKMFSLSKNGPKDTQENLKLKRKLEDIPFFKKINLYLYLVQLSFLWYRDSLLKMYDHLKFNYLTKARAEGGSILILSIISLTYNAHYSNLTFSLKVKRLKGKPVVL